MFPLGSAPGNWACSPPQRACPAGTMRQQSSIRPVDGWLVCVRGRQGFVVARGSGRCIRGVALWRWSGAVGERRSSRCRCRTRSWGWTCRGLREGGVVTAECGGDRGYAVSAGVLREIGFGVGGGLRDRTGSGPGRGGPRTGCPGGAVSGDGRVAFFCVRGAGSVATLGLAPEWVRMLPRTGLGAHTQPRGLVDVLPRSSRWRRAGWLIRWACCCRRRSCVGTGPGRRVRPGDAGAGGRRCGGRRAGMEELYRICEHAPHLRPHINTVMAQPGLSAAACSSISSLAPTPTSKPSPEAHSPSTAAVDQASIQLIMTRARRSTESARL